MDAPLARRQAYNPALHERGAAAVAAALPLTAGGGQAALRWRSERPSPPPPLSALARACDRCRTNCELGNSHVATSLRGTTSGPDALPPAGNQAPFSVREANSTPEPPRHRFVCLQR